MRLALAVLVLALAACQGAPAIFVECRLALLQGTLVGNGENLELESSSGVSQVVRWPDGVTVGRSDGTLALFGFFGQVIAREGDTIEMGGGSGPDGVFQGCGEIKVTNEAS